MSKEKDADKRVRVVVRHAVLGLLDYAPLPDGTLPPPGSWVRVPLGPRSLIGCVWDGVSDGAAPFAKLRPVQAVLDVPLMQASLRRFLEWLAGYYLIPLGEAVRMVASSDAALMPMEALTHYQCAHPLPDALLTPRQQAVLTRLAGPPAGLATLARRAEASSVLVKNLLAKGLLTPVAVQRDAAPPTPDPAFDPPRLSPQQQQAATVLVAAVQAARFQTLLLEGVTGSGKTEVYHEAVAQALRMGRQALVLLPEIALTSAFEKRFTNRFGVPPLLWHSGMTPAQRRAAWRAIADGTGRVVAGARSALFLPFADLGVILVDEEHDASYKQEEGALYNARDGAVALGKYQDCPVVLASATPALETRENAESGRYTWLKLPGRHGGAVMPDIHLIDLRTHVPPRGRWLAPPLVQALTDTLARGEQALLFLNRRGFAPLTLCRACGFRVSCPDCAAWLVDHRDGRGSALHCHHCGHQTRTPPQCPDCSEKDPWVPVGPGVERVLAEAQGLFPDARVALAASDTLTTPAKAQALIEAIVRGEIDIVVGTQLVAKGHHFPGLTLVGVVDADMGLAGADLRAAERTWQQLAQVAGRAGRAEKRGTVYLQTRDPEAPLLQALARGDGEAFYRAERAQRGAHHYPPAGRLAALILSGTDERLVQETARTLARSFPKRDDVTLLGPAPAPLAQLRGQYRVRLLLKGPRDTPPARYVAPWLNAFAPQLPKTVRLLVDIDPYSFF